MQYKSYQHIEKLGNKEVEGILKGKCSIQPKIDGTNGVVWLGDDGIIHAGSRRRDLTLDNDNAGFYNTVIKDDNIRKYLLDNPNHYLYGEWLVPHTIRYYHPESWKHFYVFDIFSYDRGYIPYDEYSKELDKYGISYIPEIISIDNPTMEDLTKYLKETKYLIPEDKMSEGIIIKNYEYRNQYGRCTYAKIVAEEFFNTKSVLRMKNHEAKDKASEKDIVTMMLSEPLIRKEFAKIKLAYPDIRRQELIGRTLNTIFHVFIHEELLDYIEKKKPLINFYYLKKECDERIKEVLRSELFK
ncbi:MAG: RNA ligase family protein [Erysipelotrichaceae bacterium]|nr:RNA ligase family protein [Erysipelotrichaceae bacterium]